MQVDDERIVRLRTGDSIRGQVRRLPEPGCPFLMLRLKDGNRAEVRVSTELREQITDKSVQVGDHIRVFANSAHDHRLVVRRSAENQKGR
jgi:hypothetical protein